LLLLLLAAATAAAGTLPVIFHSTQLKERTENYSNKTISLVFFIFSVLKLI